MAGTATYLAEQAKGLENPVDFATPATDKLKVRALRDFIATDERNQDELRLFSDEMSPKARLGLYVMLTALENAVT